MKHRHLKRFNIFAICALLLAATPGGGCFEPFTGSDVILELGTNTLAASDIVNRRGQHYELFAVINGGLVSIGKFEITPQLDALGFGTEQLIGSANRQPGDGLPESGIFFTTEANLDGATQILLSIERNGETDPTPDNIIARADVAEHNRSVLSGEIIGEVPKIGGTTTPLENSRVAIVLTEDRSNFLPE